MKRLMELLEDSLFLALCYFLFAVLVFGWALFFYYSVSIAKWMINDMHEIFGLMYWS